MNTVTWFLNKPAPSAAAPAAQPAPTPQRPGPVDPRRFR